MEIAYFDLDETIVSVDSTTLWLAWLVKQNLATETLLKEDERLLALYYEGRVDITQYIELSLLPIKGMDTEQVNTLVTQFVLEEIKPKLYVEALAKLEWHKKRGDHIVIISASSEHIVKPIAEFLGASVSFGVENEILYDKESNQQIYTGKIMGEPTFKEGKVKKILAYLANKKHELPSNLRSYAYSDSINDRFLLEFADHSYVINPNETLKQLATAKGWTVLYW
ncbi:HAD family hydrolase [Thorsellia anophelis]|uniref:HAD-superfamily subfamily IB hydrolase, TIGR01490 n=1 Tax=Thorsellia anophelis DSM 18579 TaxID=1123402 RepID=A0A1I0FXD8_9GAMM|nr:HAD family hydrolase [Thorsellia anophelis]SET62921.1 HAD-superfamily subfamily IB hydrolase, TIGR01490 [Thorsellia anophelis DSM 18579]